jgi:hypothetical protein
LEKAERILIQQNLEVIMPAVDILDLPLAMYVTRADKSDKAGAKKILSFQFSNLFSNLLGIKKIMVDGGYSGAPFADFVKTI